MRKPWLVVVAVSVFLGTLSVAPARAGASDTEEPPPPQPRPPARVSAEPGLAALQFLAGSGATVGGLLLGAMSPLALLATPFLVGSAVCAVGNSSQKVQGSCTPAIVGATVGALATVPLTLAMMAGSDWNDVDSFGNGMLAGMVLGWFVLQPLASTIAWNEYASPKPQALLPALPARDLERPPIRPPSYQRPGLAGGTAITVPLLATRF
jgi:hypothetical protein